MERASTTGTVTDTAVGERKQTKPLTLRLTQQPPKKKPVTWTEETIDNEHLNRKSSKRCCIFHKSRAFGESDSDESDEDPAKAEKELPPPGRPKNFQRHHA